MPLLITPAAPFTNDALLTVPTAYAIIEKVSYETRQKVIVYEVGYYASEAAYVAQAALLSIKALPPGFAQPATPAQANEVPILDFLEQVLTAQLTELLGEDVHIENVP